MLGNKPAALTAGATHSEGGGKPGATKIEGKFTLGEAGEQTTAQGTYDPGTDAFSFTLGRSFLEGRGQANQGIERDAQGNVSTTQGASYDSGKGQKISASHSTGAQGEGNKVSYHDDDVAGSGVKLDASAGTGTQKGVSVGAGLTLGQFENELNFDMKDGLGKLGVKSKANLNEEWSIGANLDYDLSNNRLDSMGARLGWKDPDAFRSFTLEYKGKWLADNPGYEHGFDAAFEYATGRLSGRLTGGIDLNSQQGVTGARVDALAGYKINKDWAVIGGGGMDMSKNDMNQMNQGWNARAGVQYKGVGVTAGYDGGRDAAFIRLEIPLRW